MSWLPASTFPDLSRNFYYDRKVAKNYRIIINCQHHFVFDLKPAHTRSQGGGGWGNCMVHDIDDRTTVIMQFSQDFCLPFN